MKKAVIWIVLFLGITFFAGCTKEELINGYNQILQEVGDDSLTADRKLQGERSFGVDSYVGEYEADYQEFDGEEILFGNTSLNREAGNTIKVVCKLEQKEGNIQLLWKKGAEEAEILIEDEGECSKTIMIPQAGGYLTVTGEEFTGHMELKIE